MNNKSKAKKLILGVVAATMLLSTTVAANAANDAAFTVKATNSKSPHITASKGIYGTTVGDPEGPGDGGEVTPPEEDNGAGIMEFEIAGSGCSSYGMNFSQISHGSKVTEPDGTSYDLTSRVTTAKTGHWKIEGEFSSFDANGNQCLVGVDKWKNTKTNNITAAFQNNRNLERVAEFPSTVANFGSAFAGSSFNGDVTKWKTPSAMIMNSMFKGSDFNQPLPAGFDTSKVWDMRSMFRGAKEFNQPINFSGDSLTNAFLMFSEAKKFNSPFGSNFQPSKATDLSGMFSKTPKFNQPINFDTSSAKDMSNMFSGAAEFNSPFGGRFNTENVTSMYGMFHWAGEFNQPINFDTRNVTDMSWMFFDALSFNQVTSHLNIDNVTSHMGFIGPYDPTFNTDKMPKQFWVDMS